MQQLTLFPEISPYQAKTVSVWFLKGDRLPKLFWRRFCHENSAKDTGMKLLISAASWGGHTPKPTEWRDNQFGIPYATAASKAGNTFKVEITNTRIEELEDETTDNASDFRYPHL